MLAAEGAMKIVPPPGLGLAAAVDAFGTPQGDEEIFPVLSGKDSGRSVAISSACLYEAATTPGESTSSQQKSECEKDTGPMRVADNELCNPFGGHWAHVAATQTFLALPDACTPMKIELPLGFGTSFPWRCVDQAQTPTEAAFVERVARELGFIKLRSHRLCRISEPAEKGSTLSLFLGVSGIPWTKQKKWQHPLAQLAAVVLRRAGFKADVLRASLMLHLEVTHGEHVRVMFARSNA
mmetsp:Transcript_95327/g.308837  ORF Transcript_95327/g.308837 Transcript_95327/m.308837 type:complete len:238 (-) Transcript_95327:127-840(-)